MKWRDFLTNFDAGSTSPMLSSLVKETRFVEEKEDVVVIACPSYGTRVFLDSKRDIIKKSLSSYLKREIEIVFTIIENAKTKKAPLLPLVEFQERTLEVADAAGVDNRFTFENFAVSPTNHVAYTAARAVSENPGNMYNPFLVYGGVGVGKTHLAHAIANNIIFNNPKKRILVCTSEEFTNDLIELIRKKKTDSLRKKYRNLDLLIVDDVQFIAGKTYVQEEFYHTFNAIVGGGGQIILTSDRPPKSIERLEDRLRSRFSGGLMIDIQNPDFELRTAIVLIKAGERNINMSIESARLIAEHISDTRELEGELLKLMAKSANVKSGLSPEFINESFNEASYKTKPSQISPHEVVRLVCLYYNIKPSQIRGHSRKNEVSLVRQVAMYVLRHHLGLKLTDIAFVLKRRDHTTVMHGVDKVAALLMKNPGLKDDVLKIIDQLGTVS